MKLLSLYIKIISFTAALGLALNQTIEQEDSDRIRAGKDASGKFAGILKELVFVNEKIFNAMEHLVRLQEQRLFGPGLRTRPQDSGLRSEEDWFSRGWQSPRWKYEQDRFKFGDKQVGPRYVTRQNDLRGNREFTPYFENARAGKSRQDWHGWKDQQDRSRFEGREVVLRSKTRLNEPKFGGRQVFTQLRANQKNSGFKTKQNEFESKARHVESRLREKQLDVRSKTRQARVRLGKSQALRSSKFDNDPRWSW